MTELERLAAAWDEGHRTPRVRDPHADCRCEAWSESECACGEYGRTIPAANPYRSLDSQATLGELGFVKQEDETA